jgi:hypothetical protein
MSNTEKQAKHKSTVQGNPHEVVHVGFDWSFFIVFLTIHMNGLRCYITLVHLDDLEQRHLIKRADYDDECM